MSLDRLITCRAEWFFSFLCSQNRTGDVGGVNCETLFNLSYYFVCVCVLFIASDISRLTTAIFELVDRVIYNWSLLVSARLHHSAFIFRFLTTFFSNEIAQNFDDE